MPKFLSNIKERWPGKPNKKPGSEQNGNDRNRTIDHFPIAPQTASSDIDPWERAYQIMLVQQPELMAKYAKHLSHSPGETASSADLSTARSVESIVYQLLKDREAKQWRISLLGKEIKIREHAENLIKFLLWTDPIVKGILSAEPYAQLAWSGVSLLLPLLTSGTTQNEAMLKGFISISNVQLYWQIYEEKCPRSEHQQNYRRLIEPLARLYSQIIEYQAYAICHLSRTQISRARVDVFGSNNWDNMAREIEKFSGQCSKFIQLFDKGEIRKYWEKQLQKMQKSQDILDEIRQVLEEGGMQTIKIYKDEREKQLLHDLASNYQSNKDDVPMKEKDTCKWVFEDNKFCKWRESASSCLLWVTAGPGCGKSVLSRALIDEGRLSTDSASSIICYFFFKDGDEGRRHSTDALCALLHQIFTQDLSGDLIREALPSHKRFGKLLAQNFSELWQIFMDCCKYSKSRQVVCILDALDECDEKSRQRFIKQLRDFCSESDPRGFHSNARFLITSRSYPDLEASFGKLLDTTTYWHFDHLDGDSDDKSEEISKEINLVIDARLRDITRGFDNKDRDEISKRLKLMKNRTYLWLYLTFDAIERSGSMRRVDVESLLAELSEEVSEKYEKILGRSKNQHQTRVLLQILLATTRPLTVDEANVALTLALRDKPPASHTELQSDMWPRQNFPSLVKELCGLFVNIHDGRLSFIHQTAREFLLDSKCAGNWKGRFIMQDAHKTILRSCLYNLVLPDLQHPHLYGRDNLFNRSERAFLNYAATQWPLHFSQHTQDNGSGIEKETLELALHLYDTSSRQYWIWSSTHADTSWKLPKYASPLDIAATLGHKTIVQHLIDVDRVDINLKSSTGKTPLSYAVVAGHEGTVKQLLDTGQANVDLKDDDGITPLSYAAENGSEAIVKQLLDTGQADVNARDNQRGTPLTYAAVNGYEAIVKQLLDTGQADINLRDGSGLTPLSFAAAGGHEAIVKRLLDTGKADIDLGDDHGRTPVIFAANNGHEAIVKLLESYKTSQRASESTV